MKSELLTLPKDLSLLDESQKQAVILYLSKKPLKDLRRRQHLVALQMKCALHEVSVINLQHMDLFLQAAILLQTE